MKNEICSKCGREKREHEGPKYSCLGLLSGKFKPSGRVVVPVAFVEAVRSLRDNLPPFYAFGDNEAACKMAHGINLLGGMLDQIEKE